MRTKLKGVMTVKSIDDIKYDKKESDFKLFKRMLKYAVPFWKKLLAAFLFIILVTLLELVNPYLVKIAIDKHISGDKIQMAQVNVKDEKTLSAGSKNYRRISDIPEYDNDNSKSEKTYIIEKKENKRYLVNTKDKNERILLNESEYRRFRQNDINAVSVIAFIYLFVLFLRFISDYMQQLIISVTSEKIIFNMRSQLFNHMLTRSLSFFDSNGVGRLVTRITNDIQSVNEMYTNVMITLFKDVFMLLGLMAAMLLMDVKLSLYAFVLIPVVFIISYVFRKRVREIFRESRKTLATINSKLNENIMGMRLIQIFSKENKIKREFDDINLKYLKIIKRQIKSFSLYRPSIDFLKNLGIAILIYFGGKQVLGDVISFGMLYVFIDYIKSFFAPIMDLTEKYNTLQSAMTSSERVFSLLDDDSEIKDPEHPVKMGNIEGEIEFRNVSFSYNKVDPVLKNVSFKVKKGESIALVGPTGAGKTSIISLLTRFYDIDEGEILIDGVNIKNIAKENLRKYVAVVLQDVFMFAGSIKDNISLDKEVPMEKIKEIAEYVHLDGYINKFKDGYMEKVSERGLNLSGGERQLLSFARTLCRDPKILVLDEATANIDTETEIYIQDALKKIINGRTTIAIAHRLSTIQHVDRIIVLKNGKIAEEGTHNELLNRKGLYYNLYRLQYKEDF